MVNIKQKKTILDLFKMAVVEENVTRSDKTVKKLLEYGYVCDNNIDIECVLGWIKDNKFNPNATFYKTFEDVTSRTRFELFMDQILHYFTSYTLEMDQPFVVNDTPIDLKSMNVKFIKGITFDEAVSRCQNMLYSGVALKQNTIENILDVIGDNIDIDKVKNREAQAIIATNKGIFPTNPENALRCFIYQITGKTLLIKDRGTIETLKKSQAVIPDFLLDRFSEIFFRFKPLFLAMKKQNQYKINKLRRMATKNHVSFKAPFWSKVISIMNDQNIDLDEMLFNTVNKRIDELTTYKMIALYNLCNVRLHSTTKHNMYIIRNGKMFVKDGTKKYAMTPKTVHRLVCLKNTLIGHITKRVKDNVGTNVVELPLNINLVCPTSEKSFMGEIPLYSWVDLDFEDTIIGIYWHENDGVRDLDLSYIDKSGMKIGWNSKYYDGYDEKTFIYSGDMTRAVNGASELLYKKSSASETIGSVRVNPYAFINENISDDDWESTMKGRAKYKVFFAKENINQKRGDFKNYMVDPDNIIYQYDDVIEGEKILGTFFDNKFVFANMQSSKKRVSGIDNINGIILDIFTSSHQHYLTLDSVLKKANVNMTYSKDKILSKDDILKIFE
jgi:hypothetical protein